MPTTDSSSNNNSASADSSVVAWLTGRLPAAWTASPAHITVDRDEITIMLTVAEPALAEGATEADRSEALAGRARGFREETRDVRMQIAREAEHRFERKVAWGVVVGDRKELFTHVAVPVMTRLRQPERIVLDTLVAANVARSRSDALAWCVRLVGQHTGDWLSELRDAMQAVDRLRSAGPSA
jgi:hypothetical protein